MHLKAFMTARTSRRHRDVSRGGLHCKAARTLRHYRIAHPAFAATAAFSLELKSESYTAVPWKRDYHKSLRTHQCHSQHVARRETSADRCEPTSEQKCKKTVQGVCSEIKTCEHAYIAAHVRIFEHERCKLCISQVQRRSNLCPT